jgi:GNAT superfamily N-acetyltransferase
MEIVPAVEYSYQELADLFTEGFVGYPVPVKFSREELCTFIRMSSVDLNISPVARLDGKDVGILLLGTKGWSMRGAGMGIVPDYRNRGIGTELIREWIKIGKENGYKHLLLEVIDDNKPAINIYKNCGFKIKHQLFGYERPIKNIETDLNDTINEIDPLDVTRILAVESFSDITWQYSSEYFAGLGPKSTGYSLNGKSFAIVTPKTEDTIRINALVTRTSERGNGWAKRMLAAIIKKYPEFKLELLAALPEHIASDLLKSSGFEKISVGQYEMTLDL